MKRTIYSLFLVALFGLSGTKVWADELTTTEIDGVAYYEIGTAADLMAFADLVNGGQFDANAILTADIDMSSVENWTAIGDWGGVSGTANAGYKGHFNGQGHNITGINFTASHNYYAIFGVVLECTIENFKVEGTITNSSDFQYAGTVAAYARGESSPTTIRNIHSFVNINNESSHATARIGGIVGAVPRNGAKALIENCTYSGTLNTGTNTGNYGGIIGYIQNNNTTYVEIANCLFDGKLKSEAADNCQCGGIVGYTRAGIVTLKNCLSIGTFEFNEGNKSNIGLFAGRITNDSGTNGTTFANNYYLGDYDVYGSSGGGPGKGPVPVEVTAEQLASGEVCYKLNGDQTEIGWHQTLGTDTQPVLDDTHAQVYMVGRLHCNGTPYEGSTYTNEETSITQDEHNPIDGFCSYCGLFFEDFFSPNADGFYEIANANQLVWFENLVNGGTYDANAILTDDIALTTSWTAPIGTTDAKAYTGIFDGQGHKITDFDVTSIGNGGFFGCTNGATIKNFSISGILTATAGTGSGVVGWPANSRIANIHSTLEIAVPVSGVHHVGGVVGSARGNNIIDGCSFSGTMTVAAGSTDNFAGVVSYLAGDSVVNCANFGTITFADAGCAAGGVVGYLNNTTSYIRNCLNIGAVVCEATNPKYGGAIIGRIKNNWSNTRVVNNYWLIDSAYGPARKDDGSSPEAASAEGTPEYILASGEICWKLNEESFIDPIWRQTIEDENYPRPYGDGAIVFQTPDGYDCISDEESFDSFRDNVIAVETEFVENTVAYTALLNEYANEIKSWEDIDNLDDFMTTYKASFELKESIKTSAANYVAYTKACEAAATYMEENELEGEWATLLKNYLEGTVEPNSDYPNGNYTYIMESCELDDAGIAAEIDFVNQLLENAIAGGITSGTEITRLLVNPTFANGYEGWTEEHDGGTATVGGKTEIMPIAETSNNNSSNVNQTLTEMPNGIYVMDINGLFLSSSDIYSQFYAGQLYLNNTVNYFMSIGEGAISEDEAEPGVNCLGENGDIQYSMDDIVGWVPNSRDGCSYAFKAGRYQNFCATEVTDGTLTVGTRNLGTGQGKDWMPFGNIHIYYMGTADEANDKLADVLEGYVARAQVILDLFWTDDSKDFVLYPNMSEDLKGQLEDAILAADGAASGEDKMELINVFSDLFNKVHACRKAYIEMLDKANSMFDFVDNLLELNIITDEEYNAYNDLAVEAQSHYLEGDVSTEEALALAERMNIADQIMPSVDGVYQLATVQHLQLFSMLVNNGETNAKAVMTDDIDMSGVENFEPIGRDINATNGTVDYTNAFKGEFDGQGHKITNFGQYIVEGDGEGYYTMTMSGDAQGLFGLTQNAVIKNFSIDGTFTYTDGTGYGAIGWAYGTTISNVHSSLKLVSGATSHHIGGICGDMRTGSKAIGCSFSGTITDNHNTHDCIAGIGGYSNENCLYENCANYGTITFSNAGSYAGGICGYVNNDSFTGIFNCLNVGSVKIESGTPTYGGAIVGRLRGHANSKFENNFWLEGSAARAYGEGTADATTVNAEQLASGEVCYKLNGDQAEINWFQTLGADEFPVLYDTHKVVYKKADGTYTNEETHTGTGTQNDPFVVKSATDLSNLLNLLVSGRMNYVVMEDDVDMAGVTDWTPLFNIADQSNGYPFIDFDGKGHVISNLTSNAEGDYAYNGLFGILCGNVRNLGVENADVTCAGGTGILAGYLGHSTFGQPCYVENVWVTGKVTANGYCGGMFGNVACESHFLNCYANVEVNGSGELTGGIIGRVRAKIDMTQVYAAGSINRGGGIIGGGYQDATPAGTYNRVAVWNNTDNNFGPVRDSEELSGILYYDGTNFADLQTKVVEWDPNVWSCDMQPGSYPVLAAFDPDGIKGVVADKNGQAIEIYNLAGQRLEKMQKGINIVNGKKVLVK